MSNFADNVYRLVLGSASPRRAELLTNMGCRFEVVSADIDESQRLNECPEDYVIRLAKEKASHVWKSLPNDQIFAVLAADTIVAQGQTLLGKPKNFQHAEQMWKALSGTSHSVLSGISLCFAEAGNLSQMNCESGFVSTEVVFADISSEQMKRYWESGEPCDKAGGYGIQGLASAWVQLINGSYSNVVGLPLRETNLLLQRVGHNWL